MRGINMPMFNIKNEELLRELNDRIMDFTDDQLDRLDFLIYDEITRRDEENYSLEEKEDGESKL